ncbi:MAG: hypothetical protein ACKOE8_10550 [Opitutaceae bacterium]
MRRLKTDHFPAAASGMIPMLAVALVAAWTPAGRAAKAEFKAEKKELRREMAGGDDGGRKPSRGDKDSAASNPKARADEAAARNLERLRDQLGVEDDAEWAVVLERINRVNEARSSLWKGSTGGKPTPIATKKGDRSSRSANPEQDSLRYAVRDNLPDAEVKARLTRARNVHEQAEARLQQAQSDLRAVLTIRQEAIAVLAGLLPP